MINMDSVLWAGPGIFLGGYSKEISEFFFVSTSLVKVNLNGNFKNEFQVG